jgi:glycosyltransferase involved in cell wall biosynthesis
MLAKLVTGMDPARFSTSVVSMIEPGPLATPITAKGIPVETLSLKRGVPNPLAVLRLGALLRARRPAVLQTWMYHANLLGLLAARLVRGPKVVWNIRCADLNLDNEHRNLRALLKVHAVASRLSDATVVNSGAGMRFHQSLKHRPPRWELIPNGFDLVRFRADATRRKIGRENLGLNDDAIAIGMVARFDPMKDHANFIAAAGQLSKTVPNAVFILAGTGLTTENQDLVCRLRDAGVFDKTRLLGEVADPSGLFPCLDLASLSSASGEGFPNSLGEAMSCEIPCVATDVGDSAQIVGDSGTIVPPRDHHALARGWSDLILSGPDSMQRRGKSARARIALHYSLQAIVERYQTLYTQLAGV